MAVRVIDQLMRERAVRPCALSFVEVQTWRWSLLPFVRILLLAFAPFLSLAFACAYFRAEEIGIVVLALIGLFYSLLFSII